MSVDARTHRWEAGAAAVRSLGGPHQYACPLCLRLFRRDHIWEHLSLDHVPPESVGGTLQVLTCKECNSTAGAKLDAHAARLEHIRRIVAGERYPSVPASVTFDSVTVTMELRSDHPLQTEILGVPACNRPGLLEDMVAVLEGHVKAGTTPSIEFTLPTLKFSVRRVIVSYLRAAYLAAFAVFGYSAIAWPNYDRVRQQIREPDAEHLNPNFFCRCYELQNRQVAVVMAPKWCCSIVVLMGAYQVLLPLPNDVGLYERISQAAHTGTQTQMQCESFEWPKWPIYLRDRKLSASGSVIFNALS